MVERKNGAQTSSICLMELGLENIDSKFMEFPCNLGMDSSIAQNRTNNTWDVHLKGFCKTRSLGV
ncbi:hypothetical protein H5410_016004 [Solanum commersonii]|uniref:Uncharacterized protein n=1 Tax=Solanum commersonii TaxID=4109 RepID=A0A9J5ZW32_SOLCO|nr:hypothetical protein H5410_016004 [Solanum commersonii]